MNEEELPAREATVTCPESGFHWCGNYRTCPGEVPVSVKLAQMDPSNSIEPEDPIEPARKDDPESEQEVDHTLPGPQLGEALADWAARQREALEDREDRTLRGDPADGTPEPMAGEQPPLPPGPPPQAQLRVVAATPPQQRDPNNPEIMLQLEFGPIVSALRIPENQVEMLIEVVAKTLRGQVEQNRRARLAANRQALLTPGNSPQDFAQALDQVARNRNFPHNGSTP